MLTCTKCLIDKDESQFNKSNTRKRGYVYWCKTCTSNVSKAYKGTDKAKKLHAANAKAWRRRDPRLTMWINARRRAAKKGIDFTITTKDIVVPEYCPALGMKLAVAENNREHNSPTLDRIRPGLGYVPGNVQVISALANSIKSDATPEQIQAVATFMKETYEHLSGAR